MNSDLLVSLRRTLVPIIVGAISASFLGADLDPDALQSVIGGLISGVYYTVVRLVELKLPGAGFLLGARKQPVYVAPEAL